MRGFQSQKQFICRPNPIEGYALRNQPMDTGRGSACDAGCDIRVAEASPGLKGVGRVQGRVVVCPESGRDATLRQRRGGVLSKRRCHKQGHRQRRQVQGRRQSCDAATHDYETVARIGWSHGQPSAHSEHALDSQPGPSGDRWVDRDLVLTQLQRPPDLG